MRLHLMGICGTFMGSLALLAQALGHEVSGSDQQVYPPMSDQLRAAGIPLRQGFDYDPREEAPDQVIVGNVMRRGLPCVEALLASDLPFTSGPQWLHDQLLRGRSEAPRWVLAVAGTHGKTTTASLLAWILESAGLAPGFLIGGVPLNFGVSARLGETPFFVIEADEYDTAFFDKRSKFVHYSPRTLILNNLEYDHADIFPDLAAIQTQCHHLMRLLPSQGRVIYPAATPSIQAVLDRGCWSEEETLGLEATPALWQAKSLNADASAFSVYLGGRLLGEVHWSLSGSHNLSNALAALAAARHVGVEPSQALAFLQGFQGVRRRMEQLAFVNGIQVYDDFAHHPTAIATTLAGLRPRCSGRLLVVLEPRSNTMKQGALRAALPSSLNAADAVFWYQPKPLPWSPADLGIGAVFSDQHALQATLLQQLKTGDCLVFMSNGSFDGLNHSLAEALKAGF